MESTKKCSALVWTNAFVMSAFLLLPSQAFCQTKSPKSEIEYKVVSFGGDANLATRRLNEMADDGWEYVGSMGTTLVAFKRSTTAEIRQGREIAKWQGSWMNTEDGSTVFSVNNDKWTWNNSQNNKLTANGTIDQITLQKGIINADLHHESGSRKGITTKAIFQIDDDNMLFNGADSPEERPKAFDKKQTTSWKRIKK